MYTYTQWLTCIHPQQHDVNHRHQMINIFIIITHLNTNSHTIISSIHYSIHHPQQECPEGVVHEDCFKDIYAKFFPHGSKYSNESSV